LNTERYSNKEAINKLVHHDHDVVAIGGKSGIVNGIEIQTTPIPFEAIDTVTLYLNPLRQQSYYEYIVALHPKRVIFNPGTENPELYEILNKVVIPYEIACTLVLLSTNQY